MFDFDATKFLIVGAAALIFIPPKDLPRVMRQAGQFVGKMKRMASEFQGQFMDAMREADMADLRREAQELSKSTRVDLGLDQLHTHMNDAVASKPFLPPPDASAGSTASSAAASAPRVLLDDVSPDPASPASVSPASASPPATSTVEPAHDAVEPAHDAVTQPADAAPAPSPAQHTATRHEPLSEPATHPA